MTDEMPPLAVRVAELGRYVGARDIGWFRQQHTAGSLAWLETHLGPTEYSALGAAIEAGDMDLVGRRLAVMDVVTPVVDQPLAAVPIVEPAVGQKTLSGRVIGDPLSSDLDDPTLIVSRHGAVLPAAAVRRERNTLIVTAIVLTLIAAGVVAYLLLRNSNDKASDTSIATETIIADTVVGTTAVPSEPLASPAPPTSVAITTLVAPTIVPPNAAATLSVTAAPSIAAVPAPVATVPSVDAVTTASRSATFGPYLAMVDAAGLTNELRELKNVTFLAPTESAFAALPTEVDVATSRRRCRTCPPTLRQGRRAKASAGTGAPWRDRADHCDW